MRIGEEKIMRKEIFVREIDCPSCAMKIERRVQRLEHVDSAILQFIAETLVVEADEKYMDEILTQTKQIIYDVEPDAEIEGI